jgi:hypothetical protein
MFRRSCLALLVALQGCIGVTSPSGAPPDEKSPGTWVILALMLSARQELAVAEVGGFGEAFAPVGTVEAYDPSTNRWEVRAPVPLAVHHPAAVSLNGKLYALGGTRDRPLAVHEVYDPATNRWSARNPMPTPRDHLAVVSLEGRLFTIGGRRSFFGEKYA